MFVTQSGIAWKKNMNGETNEVYKKRMSIKMDLLLLALSLVGVFGYAWVLKLLGGNLPLVDSMSTVLSVIAQILMIKRFMEQWLVWIAVDVVSVIMWVAALSTEGASISVLLMWAVFLINAVIMFVKWFIESKKVQKEEAKNDKQNLNPYFIDLAHIITRLRIKITHIDLKANPMKSK